MGLDHEILVNILLFDAKAASPLVQGNVLVIVQVTGLEKAGGAVLHGDEGCTQWSQLCVGQVPVGRKCRGPEAWESPAPQHTQLGWAGQGAANLSPRQKGRKFNAGWKARILGLPQLCH